MVSRITKGANERPLMFPFFILLIQLVFSFSYADATPLENEGNSVRRTIRSPQLFGKNPLGDLSQLKPFSLNDLNEFRKQITEMMDLTALLKKAQEAEKAARSTLTNIVNSIKEKVTGLETAVNPDPGNYWEESKDCGGVIVSQTGKITYKPNDFYDDYERCIWTVRANYRSKIKVMFMSGDLEESYDYAVVTELLSDSESSETNWRSKRISPGQTNIFDGPVIFISFISDGSVRKTGFQIEFEGLGSNINTKTIYKHFHFTDLVGHFDYANLSESLAETNETIEEGSKLQATISLSPSHLNNSRLRVSIPENSLNLRPDTCDQAQLTVYNDFASLENFGRSHRCCASTCEVNEFETSNRMMLAMFTTSDASETSQLQLNWATATSGFHAQSVDTCGGLLKGDAGTISYKVDSQYDNNERCLWAIHQDGMSAAEIKVQLLKDEFEYQYDYVTVSYPKGPLANSILETKFLYRSSGAIVKVPSGIAFIQFYSDIATFGKTTGFELSWEITYVTASDNKVEGTHLHYSTEESGKLDLTCDSDASNYDVHLLNPHFLDGSPLLSEISSRESVAVFSSERGSFSKVETSSSENHESKDGTLIVVNHCSESNDPTEQNTISWSKGDKLPSNGTDGGDFAISNDECGQVLEGDSGRISYKVGKEYEVNERCTWVIKSKQKSVITVQLMSDGFESCCDGVVINALNTKTGTIQANGMIINRENRFHTFDEQVLLVLFYSDHSVVGTGFTLEFQTKGDEISDSPEINHHHLQLPLSNSSDSPEPFGPVLMQSSGNTLTIDSFVLRQGSESNNKVSLKVDSLKTNECDQDSIALYHMPNNITEFQQLKRYPNEKLCEVGGISTSLLSEVVPEEDHFDDVKVMLLAIMKVREDDPNKEASFTFT